jgi:YD repeat-containing protein
MLNRILVVTVISVLVLSIFDSTLGAQTTNPCLHIGMWWFPDPLPPGCYPYGIGEGPYSYLVACPTSACPPSPCLECSAQAGSSAPSGSAPAGSPASPISLATGNTSVSQSDVAVPGLGGGLSLLRTWNSVWPSILASYSVGLFGPNWRSTYEEIIFVGSDHYIKYLRGDGSFWSFGFGGPGYMLAAPANTSATLVQNGISWTLTFHNGEQRIFSFATGLLTTILDRNGNATQLSYDSSNRLVTVTSAASQHLYFSYGNTSFPDLVTSVTSDFGVTLSYAYDTEGRLIQFTKPDQTTVSYTYNAQSEITAVLDNNGNVLESHTYDSSGRGLTYSQASGISSLTVTYPQ